MSVITSESATTQQVVFRLGEQRFGLEIRQAREMLECREVTAVPHTPVYVRGVMNLRGKVIPVIDLRLRLGMESAQAELDRLCEMMQQCEQDHRNWLTELVNCVEEQREFKLATDPHRCSFGLWRDSFRFHNSDVMTALARFDEPHFAIHDIAAEALGMARAGRTEGAVALIERTRSTTLQKMVELFADFRRLLVENHRAIALVIDTPAGMVALAVDSVETVEWLETVPADECITLAGESNGLVAGVGKRPDGTVIQMLDANEVCRGMKAGNVH